VNVPTQSNENAWTTPFFLRNKRESGNKLETFSGNVKTLVKNIFAFWALASVQRDGSKSFQRKKVEQQETCRWDDLDPSHWRAGSLSAAKQESTWSEQA
jgi:hypothetical protein